MYICRVRVGAVFVSSNPFDLLVCASSLHRETYVTGETVKEAILFVSMLGLKHLT